jgi:hypothetical protein
MSWSVDVFLANSNPDVRCHIGKSPDITVNNIVKHTFDKEWVGKIRLRMEDGKAANANHDDLLLLCTRTIKGNYDKFQRNLPVIMYPTLDLSALYDTA